jgi:methionyl-tRNA synthetase
MLNSEPSNWSDAGNLNLTEGHSLGKSEILFTKIEDSVIDKLISKLGVVEGTPVHIPDEEITIDDFKKIKLRTALVIDAERVKKSEKLLRIQLDLGFEKRQVVAGIAKSYSPEELIGKKVLIVANLKPAKLMGLESKGMIMALDTPDGFVKILEINESIQPGTAAK